MTPNESLVTRVTEPARPSATASCAPRASVSQLHATSPSIGSDARHDDVVVPGVEPHHANVIQRDSQIVLRDGGSVGGIFLGGEPIRDLADDRFLLILCH